MVYLFDAVDRAGQGTGSVTFVTPDGNQKVDWSDLISQAKSLSSVLQQKGAGPGRPVAVLALTSRAAVTAAVAGWLTGASITFAPTPARTASPAHYLDATRRRLDAIGEPVVLVGSTWKDLGKRLTNSRWTVADLDELFDTAINVNSNAWNPPVISDADPAILQLTSGTTSAPKIVRISHANIEANVGAIKIATDHESIHGKMYSWLPLSHDMGLVSGLILPLSCGTCEVILANPADYIAQPSGWMENISRFRATSTVGPNSAYALAAKYLETSPLLDLTSMRAALCGGEPVDPEIMDSFSVAAGRHGFDPRAILPAYGLAEATVAVTMPPTGRGMRCETVDAEDLAQRGVAVPVEPSGGVAPYDNPTTAGSGKVNRRFRRLPLLGKPVNGMRVRIVNAVSGRPCPERCVGDVQIQGSSVTTGYHDDASASRQLLTADGWLQTGDLGYLTQGELVITGRSKDVIIVGGRNIYPDEVEKAASRVVGVRPGNVIAFRVPRAGLLGGEGLGIAVETHSSDHAAVRAAIIEEVNDSVYVHPALVVVLEPGGVPKTPSGKLQRSEAARIFLSTNS
ncbi:AMP-binding protein [Frankia sp. AgB32]|uniref:AMP-binding protein n=1 Tax=Frankia sp. AgB32 TaxID=631119 RepID=UPI00200C3C92|nr:AMP-binding protein [Frankia sp. AgB32]MCK9897942.1 AMP-binding protein [Frankia sp. AgB32]